MVSSSYLDKYPIFLGANITTGKDKVLSINTSKGKYSVKGEGIINIIEGLKGLKGIMTLRDIIRDDVAYLNILLKLEKMGVIMLLNEPLEDVRDSNLINYLSRYVSNPVDVLSFIKKAKLLLLGLEGITEKLKDLLLDQGFSDIQIVQHLSDIEHLEGEEYVLLTVTSEDKVLLHNINKIALAKNIKWVPTVLARKDIKIGPALFPKESSCYNCYETIKNGIYQDEDIDEVIIMDTNFLTPALTNKITGILADTVMELVGKYKTSTLWGQIITIGLDNRELSINKVNKLSTCLCYEKENASRIKRWEYEL
jgi:hypothetical protein